MAGSLARRSLVIHSAFLMHHFFVWHTVAHLDYSNLPPEGIATLRKLKNMGGRFLTMWNFSAQTIYLILALVDDILTVVGEGSRTTEKNSSLSTKLKWFSGYLFSSFVWPFSIYIPLLFWSVYIYDRDLIFPTVLDYVFPVWTNHSLHSVIVPVVLVELLLMSIRNRHPPPLLNTFLLLTVAAAFYVTILVATHFFNNVWLYEYLTVMTWSMRLIYFAVTYLLLCVIMKIGHSLQLSHFHNMDLALSTGRKKH